MKAFAVAIICLMALHAVSCSRDPKEWKLLRSARADETISFHVALHQRNTDLLEKHLYETSDPTHPRYGESMTQEQIMDLIAPPQADHDAVVNWFKSQGNVHVQSFGDALKITAPVHLVEKMLKTRLHKFQNARKPQITAIRQVGGFSIPEEISDKIYMITGLTMFPFVRKDVNTKLTEKLSAMDQQDILAQAKRQSNNYPYVSISNLRSVYNVPTGTAAKSAKTNQVAMEFLPVGSPLYTDVQQFCQMSNEVYTNYSKIIGPFVLGQEDTESTLDVELLTGLGTKVTNWYYTISTGWIYEMALELFNLKEVPQVVSISYGWPESDSCDAAVTGANCGSMSVAQWVNRTNLELVKVGLRRVSLLAATQDEGAPGPTNSDCSNSAHPVFAVYPSSSPYITAISGTTLTPPSSSDEHMKRDVAQNNLPICQQGYPCVSGTVTEWPCMSNNTYYGWTTGGGFSEITSMPSYQAAFVQQYLRTPNLFIPPAQFFNAANRGYPDFSAVGSRLLTINGGGISIGAGTSAATPIAAALIALLNDARAVNNKTPLGFLNPMLYKMYSDNPATFNDVTLGDNHCSIGQCCTYGYGATKGWDAVTGLGTPNFVAMRKYVTANLP
jgi:tripeptidyl-peptidase-1